MIHEQQGDAVVRCMHDGNDYQRAGEVRRTFRNLSGTGLIKASLICPGCSRLCQGALNLYKDGESITGLAICSCIWLLWASNAVASLPLTDWPFSLQHRQLCICPARSGWSVFSRGEEEESLEGSSASQPLLAEGSLPCTAVSEQSCCVPAQGVKAGAGVWGTPVLQPLVGDAVPRWVWTWGRKGIFSGVRGS